MNQRQIIDKLKSLGKELARDTVVKVEENDKVFAVMDIEDTIHDLNILIYEIKRM